MARRIRELVPLVQAGQRSISEEEAEFITQETLAIYSTRRMREMSGDYAAIVSALSDDVYLTVDLDVLDPAECPGTGTPEPGGLRYIELVSLIEQVARKKRIVGFDITELMPMSGDTRSEFLAARLLYRMWGWTLVSQGKHPGPDPNRPL